MAFTMPLSVKLNSYCFILSGLIFLFDKQIILKLKTVFSNKLAVLFFVFYLLYVFSFFMSSNKTEGASILERRAALIAIPLLLLSNNYWKEYFNKILFSFVLGVFVAIIFCIIVAIKNFNGDYSSFFYHKLMLPLLFNAVYMSAYVFISIVLIVHYYKPIRVFYKQLLLVSLLLFLLLLNSKLFITLCFVYFIFILFKNTSRLKKVIAIVSALMVFFLSVIFIKPINQRFKTELQTNFNVINQQTFSYDTPLSGISLRLLLWKQSTELLTKNNSWLLGLYTGDFQDALNKRYKEINLFTGDQISGGTGYIGYGPHNQFVEIAISLGITGLMFFIYFLFYQIRLALFYGNVVLLQILVTFCLFFMSESVLSVSKGVIAFAFFSILLQAQNFNEKHSH